MPVSFLFVFTSLYDKNVNRILRLDNIVLQRLREHDSEIISLQWTLIESPPMPTPTPTLIPTPAPTPLPLPSKQTLEPIQSVSEDTLKVPTPSKSRTASSAPKSPISDRATTEIDDLSNRSTIGSSHNTVEIAEPEEVIENLNINDATLSASDANGFDYLASGAQESSIVIWNTEDGTIVDKIQLKCQGRMEIPSKAQIYTIFFSCVAS